MKQIGLVFLFLATLCVVGCDLGSGQNKSFSSTTETPPAGEAAVVSESETAAQETTEEMVAAPEQPAPKTEVREVQVGDDKRGHYEKHEFIAAPVGVYFSATQGIELERITHAMNLYKAMNNDKPPATEEIFMKEVIEANRIKLPQLKEGWRYLYEPTTGKLMVEKPVE